MALCRWMKVFPASSRWRWFFKGFVLGFLFLASSCSPLRTSKPDVLLIMVEGLGEGDTICSETSQLDGLPVLKSLCPEFSRWSRAYVASTLIQTNLSSMLSGREPEDHHVLHNGPVALQAQVTTLPEVAIRRGYRTGFFSGGLPVLNKFGVHQGFEIFDDTSILRDEIKGAVEKQTSNKTMGLLRTWIEDEIDRAPYFASLYLPSEPGVLESPLERPMDSAIRPDLHQRRKLYVAIEGLLSFLQYEGRLKNTALFIVGLSGSRHHDQMTRESLSRPQTHVAFQIRYPVQRGGETRSHLISTTAIYGFINRALEGRPIDYGDFEQSLEGRFIKTRSDWGRWIGVRETPSFAFRRDPFVYKFLPELQVFDAFSDAKESYPMEFSAGRFEDAMAPLIPVIEKNKRWPCYLAQVRNFQGPLSKFPSCQKLVSQQSSKATSVFDFYEYLLEARGAEIDLGTLLLQKWQRGEIEDETLSMGWLLQSLVRKGDWEFVLKVSKIRKMKELELLAALNLSLSENKLSRRLRNADLKHSPSCLSYFTDLQRSTKNFYSVCDDISLLKVVEGLRKLVSGDKPKKEFWDEVYRIRDQRSAKNRNLEMQLVNDVRNASDLSYSFSELYFYLPEYRSFLDYIERPIRNL